MPEDGQKPLQAPGLQVHSILIVGLYREMSVLSVLPGTKISCSGNKRRQILLLYGFKKSETKKSRSVTTDRQGE